MDISADPRWNPFVKGHSRGVIYHHSLWLQSLQKEFGQEALALACVDENDELQGVFPLLYTRGLPWGVLRVGNQVTGRRLSSLPRTPMAGPLANSRSVYELLVHEAVRRVNAAHGTTLQIKADNNDLDGIIEGMQGVFWRESYLLELPQDFGGSVRFGNAREHHRVAWAANRAVRLGAKVREAEDEEDLVAWYALYLETMRRVVVPARPYRFFENLWRSMRPRGLMRLLLAVRGEGGSSELLAGSIFLTYSQTVHYAFTGCRAHALTLHANDLLQWEAIHWACETGFRYYDFGEVSAERLGLARFKNKWSAKAIPLYRYHYPDVRLSGDRAFRDPSDSRLVREIWQHLPLGVTEFLGGQIFRRL